MFSNDLIAGASGQSSGFYPETLDGSLRFNDNDSAYLSWTPASAGNRKTWTWSGWVKRGNLGSIQGMFLAANPNNNNQLRFLFNSLDSISLYNSASASINASVTTVALFRDPSAWYHIVLSVDTTQATSADRIKIYVNGVQAQLTVATAPSLNLDMQVNAAALHKIGQGDFTSIRYLDGYLSNVHFIDGTALDADSFGETKSGVWIPKAYTGSYGTNGFHLPLDADADDVSGNGNDWTENNLAATDYVLDSPTNNFSTMNPLDNELNATLSQGNLRVIGTSNEKLIFSTFGVTSGKWYFECNIEEQELRGVLGITDDKGNDGNEYGDNYASVSLYFGNLNTSATDSGENFSRGCQDGDVVSVALDADNGQVWIKLNSAIDTSGAAFATGLPTDKTYRVMYQDSYTTNTKAVLNFGQDSSFAGNKTAQGNTDANGIGDFYYTPPSGYLALCTANLPEPAISPADDASPQDHFNTVLYTGDGTATQAITGVGFEPDLTWIKVRSTTGSNWLTDAIRGETKILASNLTNAEQTVANTLKSFDSDGFTVGDNAEFGGSGRTFAAWNWKANGSGVSNTDGSITSTVSANTDAGFSIVSYTGNGVSLSTVGHGLSQAPELYFYKRRDNVGDWLTQTTAIDGNVWYGYLDKTNSFVSTTDPVPSSSVLTLGTSSNYNASASTYIAYCFHSVEGFSKFGSYTGNGSTDGPFVYTGFKPAFVMVKVTNVTDSWFINDDKRDAYNLVDAQLFADRSDAEANSRGLDFVSNGFKIRDNSTSHNNSGNTYIYMAFAENPFKYSTAR